MIHCDYYGTQMTLIVMICYDVDFFTIKRDGSLFCFYKIIVNMRSQRSIKILVKQKSPSIFIEGLKIMLIKLI